ncbi:hypothetical protein [Streptomyces sp. NPDC001415]
MLGYLWASNAEGAASFAPRDKADLLGYRAGLVWLARFQEAYDRGPSPMAALTEMGDLPGDPLAGQATGSEPAEVAEFWMLLDQTGG